MEKLTSNQLVKNFIGKENANGIETDRYIDVMSSLFISATNRLGFTKKQYTQIFKRKTVCLKVLPLVSIDEIRNLDDDIVLSNSDYEIDWENGVITFYAIHNYKIKYTAGYTIDFTTGSTTNELPEDITNLITQLSAALYQKSTATGGKAISTEDKSVQAESVEGQSITYSQNTESKARNSFAGISLSDWQTEILTKYSLVDYL